MNNPQREMPELELALVRRAIDDIAAAGERCRRCRRSPLIGERVYPSASGAILCELCRDRRRDPPASSRIVHGPEYGQTMRIAGPRAI